MGDAQEHLVWIGGLQDLACQHAHDIELFRDPQQGFAAVAEGQGEINGATDNLRDIAIQTQRAIEQGEDAAFPDHQHPARIRTPCMKLVEQVDGM